MARVSEFVLFSIYFIYLQVSPLSHIVHFVVICSLRGSQLQLMTATASKVKL